MNQEPLQESSSLRRTRQPITTHATWKKVWTGNCRDPNEFLLRLSSLRVELTPSARKLIDHVCDGHLEENVIALAIKTVSELGFKRPATLRDVLEVCADQGLTYCPKDTALAMSSEYSDLPEGEQVLILSIPIEIERLPCYFVVKRDTLMIELNAVSLNKESILSPSEKIVLAKVSASHRAD